MVKKDYRLVCIYKKCKGPTTKLDDGGYRCNVCSSTLYPDLLSDIFYLDKSDLDGSK